VSRIGSFDFMVLNTVSRIGSFDFMVLNTVSRIGSFDYSSLYKILAFLLLVSRFHFSHYGLNREHPKIGNSRRTHVTMHGGRDLKLYDMQVLRWKVWMRFESF